MSKRDIISNIDYCKNLKNASSIAEEMIILKKIRDWQNDPKTLKTYVDCKHKKSNSKAVKDFIKVFFKDKKKQYVSIVTQSSVYKNDSEIIYYREEF